MERIDNCNDNEDPHAPAASTQGARTAALLTGLWVYLTFDLAVTLMASAGGSLAGGMALALGQLLLKSVSALLAPASASAFAVAPLPAAAAVLRRLPPALPITAPTTPAANRLV